LKKPTNGVVPKYHLKKREKKRTAAVAVVVDRKHRQKHTSKLEEMTTG